MFIKKHYDQEQLVSFIPNDFQSQYRSSIQTITPFHQRRHITMRRSKNIEILIDRNFFFAGWLQARTFPSCLAISG